MPQFVATVREVVPEAPGTVTLHLQASIPHDYRAGQFLSVDPMKLDAVRPRAEEIGRAKGKPERARPYSLASAPHEALLAITIKEEPAGDFPCVLSPYLVHEAKVGDVLHCTGFNGLYVLPSALGADERVLHLCAGSGIVPNWGMLKDALHRGVGRHTLLFSAKTWDDVIYRDGLRELAREYPDRFQWIACLTRDASGAPSDVRVNRGRITDELIREAAPSLEETWFYACGPSVPTHERRAARAKGEAPMPRFLECIRETLNAMGIERSRIAVEGW